MPGEHARLAASNPRWGPCPGSIAAEQASGLPDLSSRAAEQGTLAHEVWAESIATLQSPEAFATNKPGVDEEMVRHIAGAYTVALELAADCDRIAVETQVDPGKAMGRDDLWGTADLILEHGSKLTVIDLKYGKYPVVPFDHQTGQPNRQLMIYALGAACGVLSAQHRVESFVLGIYQPRTSGPALTTHQIERDVMITFFRQLKLEAAATDDPDAPRVAGAHCTFCKAKMANICPEYAAATGRGA